MPGGVWPHGPTYAVDATPDGATVGPWPRAPHRPPGTAPEVQEVVMPGLIRDVVLDAARGVDHLGPTVYVGKESSGVVIVNASDPAAPAVVRTVATGTFDRRLDVDEAGARLAVASGSCSIDTGAVTCFSLANPAQPVRTVRCSSPSVAEDVAWTADRSGQTRLYAAVTSDGVVVLDAGVGRVVGSYGFLRDVAPGANRIVSMPGGAGRAVAAGVYVVRVSAGAAVWPRTVTVAR